jgi:hypothetical protein
MVEAFAPPAWLPMPAPVTDEHLSSSAVRAALPLRRDRQLPSGEQEYAQWRSLINSKRYRTLCQAEVIGNEDEMARWVASKPTAGFAIVHHHIDPTGEPARCIADRITRGPFCEANVLTNGNPAYYVLSENVTTSRSAEPCSCDAALNR